MLYRTHKRKQGAALREDERDKQTWPPLPMTTAVEMRAVQGAVQERPYLTGVRGLDVCFGVIAGLTLQWFAFYGASVGLFHLINGLLHIAKPPNQWHMVIASLSAFSFLFMIFKYLRRWRLVFATSLFWAGLFLGGLLLWLSYMMATDVGPNILPR